MGDADKVRAVLVGCGTMSSAWLNAVQELPDVEIVGLVDIFAKAASKRAHEFNLLDAVIGTNLREVLEQTRPDATFNCTIPEAHFEISIQALQAGCHVISEKPLADSLEHARQIVETARQAGKVFSVIQNRRYDQHIRRVSAFLRSGAIGQFTTVNSDFYIGAHFSGFRDHMQHVLLLDMAIHTFDAARLLTGADPVAVYCKEWNPAGSWYDHDASAVAIFEMTNNIIYTYRGSWCADGLPTSWEADWRFQGQTGSVRWDGGEQNQAQIVAETGGFISRYRDITIPPYDGQGAIGGHLGLIQEFIRCIRTGGEPETSGTDNIKSLAMVFAAIESATAGQRVAIRW